MASPYVLSVVWDGGRDVESPGHMLSLSRLPNLCPCGGEVRHKRAVVGFQCDLQPPHCHCVPRILLVGPQMELQQARFFGLHQCFSQSV